MTQSATKDKVFLREARLADIPAIESLLNRCYRNAEGWTNEAKLIGGIRTTQDELKRVIEDSSQYLFVYPQTKTEQRDGQETGEMLACICVQGQPDSGAINEVTKEAGEEVDKHKGHRKAYIGMFAVHPDLQGQGIGDVVLNAAETFAKRHFGSDAHPCRLTMSILNHRPELLAYYQRRGYQLTGSTMPFPTDGNNGEPLRDDLQLLELEKMG